MELHIAVIKGDGVGPEMMDAALGVLSAVCLKHGHELKLQMVPAAGASIEAGLGPLPDESLALCLKASAVLFGNTGLEKYRDLPPDARPETALMRLRRALGVTTNIRPVKAYAALSELSPLKEQVLRQGLNLIFVRDVAGGVFCSEQVTGEGIHGHEAYEQEYYHEEMVKDTAHMAFSIAAANALDVISLDKSNVLESSRLWKKAVTEVGLQYPKVGLRHLYIDAAAMKIVERPWEFHVIVTSNLFGDIISDEGTGLTGTPGLYASAELAKDGRGIYTPNQLHHPDETIIGKQAVNPIGMVLAAALMLRYTFLLEEEAAEIERAVERVLECGFATNDILTRGATKVSTAVMMELIIKELQARQ